MTHPLELRKTLSYLIFYNFRFVCSFVLFYVFRFVCSTIPDFEKWGIGRVMGRGSIF